jgi:hypothetical protein
MSHLLLRRRRRPVKRILAVCPLHFNTWFSQQHLASAYSSPPLLLQVKRILAAGTPVRFNIRLKVEFGQHLLVVGSCASLGAWNVDNAVRLTWQEGNVWESSVELPAG